MNEPNPKPPEQTTFPVRIRVRTAGVWRAEQVSSTLLAIDRICGRVALGSLLAETCEAYDWAIRSYGFLGFLGGKPETWEKPKSPSDVELREALATFTSLMRNAGVEATFSERGVSYRFLVDDLFDILPMSSRAEVERLRMASPGWWTLVTNALRSENAYKLLDKIFYALFFREDLKRRIRAKTEREEAKARATEAAARETDARAVKELAIARRQDAMAVLDYSVPLDTLVVSLRNAGFDNAQIQRVLTARMNDDIGTLAVHKSLGLIATLRVKPVKDDRPRRRREPGGMV